MTQYRILKFRKDKDEFFFQNVLTQFRVIDGKPQKIKDVASEPVNINESGFCNSLVDLGHSDHFLFPNTLWSSFDRGSYLIFEPPGVKRITLHLPGIIVEDYEYIHPSILYFVTTSADNKMYVAGLWYMRGIETIEDIRPDTVLYHPYLPNVFRDGMVCTHNFYSHEFDSAGSVNLNINMAIEDFWSSRFNDEVNDFLHNTESITLFNNVNPLTDPATGLIIHQDYGIEKSSHIFFVYLNKLLEDIRSGEFGSQASAILEQTFDTILQNQYHYYNVQGIIDLVIRNNPQTALFDGNSPGNSDIMNHYLLNDLLRLTYQNQF